MGKASGYCDCACRDCFNGPIMGVAGETMCDQCEEAGCELDSECCADEMFCPDCGEEYEECVCEDMSGCLYDNVDGSYASQHDAAAEENAKFRSIAYEQSKPGSAVSSVDFGDISDYYPDCEIDPDKRRQWDADAREWQDYINSALGCDTVSEAKVQLRLASCTERAWGDDPATREVARLLCVDMCD